MCAGRWPNIDPQYDFLRSWRGLVRGFNTGNRFGPSPFPLDLPSRKFA